MTCPSPEVREHEIREGVEMAAEGVFELPLEEASQLLADRLVPLMQGLNERSRL